MITHPVVTLETVEKKITAVFPDLQGKLKSDYARLVALLCDMTSVIGILRKLDRQLEGLRIFNDVADSDVMSHRKILSNVLGQKELELGFAGQFTQTFHPSLTSSGGVLPTLTGFGEPEDVKQLIQEGSHWRDIGVSTAHGEYSHRLQWYVIAESGLFQADQVKSLYTQSVSPQCTSSFYPKTFHMWDFAVDCFERDHTQTPTGKVAARLSAYDDFADPHAPISIRFRSPAILNRYLWEADDLPFLTRFTTGRRAIHAQQDASVRQHREGLSSEEKSKAKQKDGPLRSAASRKEVDELGLFTLRARNIYVPKSGH